MVADELREKRLATGLSQKEVAAACGLSRSTYSRIETASFEHVSLTAVSAASAAMGLDVWMRLFPGPEPLRDAASLKRLQRVRDVVSPPLVCATEVALPQDPSRPFEQRAWDALVTGNGRRTGMELEMGLRDAQAVERRMDLKRRDDPVDSFVFLVADTKHNRLVLREYPNLFPDLARLTFRQLATFLRAGIHPPNALVLV
jgi:transcriptional regulator with XRE-family HTH domain